MDRSNVTYAFNPRVIQNKAASYTVLATDDQINVTGAYTMTLPVISTLAASGISSKCYKIRNTDGTATVTITAGSGDTINGLASIYLKNDEEYVVIRSDVQGKNWIVDHPSPYSIRHYGAVAVTTNGTTAVNIFSALGAPCALNITGVMAVAKDTIAGNISITNGTNTVVSFAKSTTAGIVTGEDGTIDNPQVTSADTLTVVSSSTGDAHVWIAFVRG